NDSRGMNLDELHVDPFRPRLVGERMAVARIFPAVARDLVSASDSTSGKHDGFCAENFEPAALAFVAESADRALTIFQDRQDGVLHEHVNSLMNTMILERADHLQAGAVADVSEARIFVAAEMSLQDTAVFRPIEDRTPRFQFAHAISRFFVVKLSHAP